MRPMNNGGNTLRNSSAAIFCGVLVAAGAFVPAATAQAAVAPAEVTVIPPDTFAAYYDNQVGIAGATGVLQRATSTSGWVWTKYSDGLSCTPSIPATAANRLVPAGGDA